jgi:phenylacetate-CoA ligase
MNFISKVKRELLKKYFLKKNKKEYFEFQFLSQEEKEKHTLNKLKNILKIAVDTVPYYKDVQVDFKNFSFDELKKFPIVNKDIIRKELNNFMSSKNKSKGISSQTSGSSGQPFNFYVTQESEAIENLTAYRAWGMGKEYSYLPNDPVIVLRTYAPKEGEPLYRVDKVRNYWYLSPFDINNKNLELYLNIIKKSNAKIIRGYGSSIYLFTLLLKENNVKIDQIKTVVTSSETLGDLQREVIEKHWSLGVLDWYGQNERTAILQQCWAGNYHNNDDYGLVELNEKNQIIATSLNNDVMPFIRYNTEDLAIPLESKITECKCGRTLSIPFKAILGRSDDVLIKQDGTKIPTANFSTAMKNYEKLKQFKIVQKMDNTLDLYLAFGKSVDDLYIDKIKKEVIQRLGNLEINVKLVEEIERDRRTGKVKVTECLLKY